MRKLSQQTFTAVAAAALIACGGGSESAGDAATGAAATTAGAPECYLARGTTSAQAAERPSPLRETDFEVGGHDGLLCYGAPSANGRDIMGGLLAFGQLERIGANEPTTVHLTGPAVVGGVSLEPGSYSIYAIPGPDEWVFFLNSNYERWGIPIDDAVRASDVGTFTATPEPMEEFVETLRYRWEPMANNTMGDMMLEWENTRVRFHIHPGM